MAPWSCKDCLEVQNGVARLKNCHIDAVDFVRLTKTGMQHVRNDEWWQGQNAFHRALHLWQHEGAESDVFGTDLASDYMDRVYLQLVELALVWHSHLAVTGRMGEAIRILSFAWRFAPTNEELVRKLFLLHLQNGSVTQARELAAQYRSILKRQDYAAEEVEELCNRVVRAD